MKQHERINFPISTTVPDGTRLEVCAVKMGDWCIQEDLHLRGLRISHKTGILAGPLWFRPAGAVRALKELNRLPACPIPDDEFEARARVGTLKNHPMMGWWIGQVVMVMKRYGHKWEDL